MIMWFGLHNAPSTFQCTVQEIFGLYLTEFMRIFLDDLSVFGRMILHLGQLFAALLSKVQRCLLPMKCALVG